MATKNIAHPAITVRLNESDRRQLAELADKEDRPVSQMARLLISQALSSQFADSQQQLHATQVVSS